MDRHVLWAGLTSPKAFSVKRSALMLPVAKFACAVGAGCDSGGTETRSCTVHTIQKCVAFRLFSRCVSQAC